MGWWPTGTACAGITVGQTAGTALAPREHAGLRGPARRPRTRRAMWEGSSRSRGRDAAGYAATTMAAQRDRRDRGPVACSDRQLHLAGAGGRDFADDDGPCSGGPSDTASRRRRVMSTRLPRHGLVARRAVPPGAIARGSAAVRSGVGHDVQAGHARAVRARTARPAGPPPRDRADATAAASAGDRRRRRRRDRAPGQRASHPVRGHTTYVRPARTTSSATPPRGSGVPSGAGLGSADANSRSTPARTGQDLGP